jgi:hypothetical protein
LGQRNFNLAHDSARNVAAAFLRNIRQEVARRSLNEDRLPRWLQAARVRVGWINASLVIVYEDAPQLQTDTYEILGPVGADTVVLLNVDNFQPPGAVLQARESRGFLVLVGEVGQGNGSVFSLVGQRPAFFDCGYAGYHGPRALLNLFFQHVPDDSTGPVAMRFIPFALYVHDADASDPIALWQRCEEQLMNLLTSDIHDTEAGIFYENQQGRVRTFAHNKETGVIILGKDSGPELEELREVRDFLRARGYDADLIKELPEIPMMSNEEKVRLWAIVSRFCVMIDRMPTGHIAEYPFLREQRSILAVLRPRGSGSTYMIGDDHLVDVNFINVCEFEETPLNVLDEVIEWAEGIAAERVEAYRGAYPWRD